MKSELVKFDSDTVYTFIDCETLNLCLNGFHNLPWQIAMIKVKDYKKVDQKNFYIKWDTDLKISEDAARITRFNPSVLNREGKSPESVFPKIDEWLKDCDYIVGHNLLGFDIYILKILYDKLNSDYSFMAEKMVDTLSIARGYKFGVDYNPKDSFLEYQYKMIHKRKKGVKTSLSALGKEFNIEHDYSRLHDALVDLELNIKIWNKLKTKLVM